MKPKRLPRVGDVWERYDGCRPINYPGRVVVMCAHLGGSLAAEESVEIVNSGADGQRPMRSRLRLDTFLRTYEFVNGAR